MKRPSLSLTMIVKNEEDNLPRLFESVKDCFDELIIVDTGSTDKTKEIAQKYGARVFDFEWCDDFSAARNFALDQVKTDYAMWLDGDDVLAEREAFIKWRDHAMAHADYWLATYNYALDKDGKPILSFVRERVFNMSKNPRWQYFLHEGIIPKEGYRPNYITTWHVNHMRTEEDVLKDRSRNITIIESRKGKLDNRMRFYYGKELYEHGQHEKALSVLTEVCTEKNLELHDRVLAIQYACYSAQCLAEKLMPEYREEKYMVAMKLAHQGLVLDSKRAEFYCILGECNAKLGKYLDAIPYFKAAKGCYQDLSSKYQSAIFNYGACYGELPGLMLAKCLYHIAKIDDARIEALECAQKYNNDEAKKIVEEIDRIKPFVTLEGIRKKTDEILITCPPQNAYEFDTELYKTEGMGGSETACVEMATWLKRLTNRPVTVFNMRQRDMTDEYGVNWVSSKKLNEYLSEHEPRVHVAWRHNIKLTNAPTYLWCHDLYTPGVESIHNFDKHMCLSQFHKDYVMAMQGVPESKLLLTRNGLTPEKFDFNYKNKDENKLVWMSSPDRGLDRAILVTDMVRQEYPDVKLHVYYGLDNLYKYGLGDFADHLKQMMADRKDYIIYHGFTEQKKMYHEISDAVLWLHPCDFIESFCITALEMLALGIYPVTRKLGALQNTLKDAELNGQAILLDHDCVSQEEFKAYAKATINALKEKKWIGVDLDIDKHSWKSVAQDWVKMMGI